MPLNNSLISGAQSLFGVKTELKFGKTRIKAIFSEQNLNPGQLLHKEVVQFKSLNFVH